MEINDVRTIVDNLDDFIELPDGIERLRKAVLTLAVSGRLVPQDPKEGTAEELLADIQKERGKHVASGTGRKRKAKELPQPSIDHVPFEIPASWKWVRIRDVTHDCGQKIPDTDFCYVDVSAIDSSRGVITEPKYLDAASAPSRARKIVKNGSVIYSSVRPYLLNTAVVDTSKYEREIIASTAFFVLEPDHGVSSEYIHTLVRSPYFDERVSKDCVGVAYPAINDDKFEKILIPLPPPAEQKRILEKVGAMMKQLDELEAKKKERDAVRTRLTQNAMRELGEGKSESVLGHLTELIKTPSDLKELEGAILTLAISGKLVPQNPKDKQADPASLTSRKRKSKELPPVAPDEMPFQIPKSWKWQRFGSVFSDYGSGSTPSRGNNEYFEGNVNWYKSGELNDGVLSLDSEEKVTDLALKNCHLRMNVAGDLLIAMYGATAGRIAILENEGVTNQAVWGGTPLPDADVQYLFLYLLQSRSSLIAKGAGAAQPNISGEKILFHPLPLPPPAEQKRIVLAVENIRSYLHEMGV